MSEVDLKKHAALVRRLEELKDISLNMKRISSDDLLPQFIEECKSWLEFAKIHTDSDELKSLKREIISCFYRRYNVRIEPKDLDNQRLSAVEKLIDEFELIF